MHRNKPEICLEINQKKTLIASYNSFMLAFIILKSISQCYWQILKCFKELVLNFEEKTPDTSHVL